MDVFIDYQVRKKKFHKSITKFASFIFLNQNLRVAFCCWLKYNNPDIKYVEKEHSSVGNWQIWYIWTLLYFTFWTLPMSIYIYIYIYGNWWLKVARNGINLSRKLFRWLDIVTLFHELLKSYDTFESHLDIYIYIYKEREREREIDW